MNKLSFYNIATPIIHIEKRDQARFTTKRKKRGNLKRRLKTIILDSESIEDCNGISVKMRHLELKAQMLIASKTTLQI
jgi:hypothetical protein